MITSIKKTGGASFTYEWTGVAPYRLYQSGVLLTDNTVGGTVLDGATTNSTSRVFQSTDKYEPPAPCFLHESAPIPTHTSPHAPTQPKSPPRA